MWIIYIYIYLHLFICWSNVSDVLPLIRDDQVNERYKYLACVRYNCLVCAASPTRENSLTSCNQSILPWGRQYFPIYWINSFSKFCVVLLFGVLVFRAGLDFRLFCITMTVDSRDEENFVKFWGTSLNFIFYFSFFFHIRLWSRLLDLIHLVPKGSFVYQAEILAHGESKESSKG